MIERRATESWEDVADRRIRQAQADGLFDKLPGFSQPIPGIDDPPDENWWLKQKLRDEQLSALPPRSCRPDSTARNSWSRSA